MFNSDHTVPDVDVTSPLEPYTEAVSLSKEILETTRVLVVALQERDSLYRRLSEVDEFIAKNRALLRKYGERLENVVM